MRLDGHCWFALGCLFMATFGDNELRMLNMTLWSCILGLQVFRVWAAPARKVGQ